MSIYVWLNIASIIVAVIGIVIGFIGYKSLKIANKTINKAKNTGAGSIQQAEIINNGLDTYDVVKLSQDVAEKTVKENFVPITPERVTEVFNETADKIECKKD